MEDLERRLRTVEDTLERHSTKIMTIEGKLLNDYNNITTLLSDVRNLKEQGSLTQRKLEMLESMVSTFIDKVDKMASAQEARDSAVNRSLKRLSRLMVFAVLASLAAVVYATVKNGTTASAITTLVTTLGKLGLGV